MCSRTDHERAAERLVTSRKANEKAAAEWEASTGRAVRSGCGAIHQRETIEEGCDEADQGQPERT